MREHRALGRACGAAGILDDGEFVGERAERVDLIIAVVVDEIAERDTALVMLDVSQHPSSRHLRLDRLGRGGHLGEFADDKRFEAGGSEQFFGLGIARCDVETDKDVGLAVFDLQLERRQRVQGRVVDDCAACFQHAEKGDDVVRRVGKEETDMHAGPDAKLLEAGGCAVRERVELRVGYALVHEVERGLRAKSFRGFLQHALYGRELKRRVLAHVWGIGLHPRMNRHRLSSRFLLSRLPASRPAAD